MNKRHNDPAGIIRIRLNRLHSSQLDAHRSLLKSRRKILRAGRRWGKTEYATNWIEHGLIQGQRVAWFAPQNKMWAEVFATISHDLRQITSSRSKTGGVLRTTTGGRLDLWTLENPIAGRGRGYDRIVIDEAAFGKDGDNKTDGSTMATFEKAILPTLYDTSGEILVCSNSAGKNPDNFFYNLSTDPIYGFTEFHATTADNPLLPLRLPNETTEAWQTRRAKELQQLVHDNDALVYAQEYQAEFVDWDGVAFFDSAKLLVDGRPVSYPRTCQSVFAVIDTAVKTGTNNDGTAVTFFAVDKEVGPYPLFILDWDVVQIEGALLETWLPQVFERLEELARMCRARLGSLGVLIEDKNSGTVLLQQAARRGWQAHPIESKLTSLGKDERALNVSGYVFQGKVKFTEPAFVKTTIYKRRERNHLLEQILGFRIGDKDNKREDDLLDTFCYGLAVALGSRDGF